MTAKKIIRKVKPISVNVKPKTAAVPESAAEAEFLQGTYAKDYVFPIVGLGASAGG